MFVFAFVKSDCIINPFLPEIVSLKGVSFSDMLMSNIAENIPLLLIFKTHILCGHSTVFKISSDLTVNFDH